ncbi:MAG TPA: lipoyl synthase, partial [Candidatus Xenobia bacterium]
TPSAPRPDWIKVRFKAGENYLRLHQMVTDKKLHTVCQEARCPNIFECWEHGTGTFMILGETCTRSCGFCSVIKGRPTTVDRQEPQHVAEAVRDMGLSYAVVTSVDRDDLADFGAHHFADTIRQIREVNPGCQVEVLIPDFNGSEEALNIVLDALPDVLNHNTETVPRLYRTVRPRAGYEQTLKLLKRASDRRHAGMLTKSGIMVGLGETREEISQVLQDLHAAAVDILTVGQYLRPSMKQLPVVKYYHPDEFADIRQEAMRIGFRHCESGPLVRSSYHAHEQTAAAL